MLKKISVKKVSLINSILKSVQHDIKKIIQILNGFEIVVVITCVDFMELFGSGLEWSEVSRARFCLATFQPRRQRENVREMSDSKNLTDPALGSERGS